MNKYILFCFIILFSCNHGIVEKDFSMHSQLQKVNYLEGKSGNGEYLYVTAGNTLYSIGNQYGQFPEVGFHVPGEMGGIWQHPIKLADGFRFGLYLNGQSQKVDLNTCDRFITYPFANQFEYKEVESKLRIIRTDFVPDSLPVLVIEYKLYNDSKNTIECVPAFEFFSDLSPVWLGERSGMTDGEDVLYPVADYPGIVIVKDNRNEWFTGITSDRILHPEVLHESSPYQGKGIALTLSADSSIVLTPGKEISFRYYISGSMKSPTEIDQHLRIAKENLPELFREKQERYQQIDQTAAIRIPDTLLMQTYQWGKYNTDWLVRDVSDMGNGLSAGLPDYPWFFSNDQAATFKGLLGTRNPELFYNSWAMLKRISDEFNNHSGQIIHEVSTNGAVYDKGRMEESQEFIITAWYIFKWTGNIEFLRTYYEHGKKVWKFLQAHDTNNNLYVEGYGGTEIEGLNDEMLDVAAHTQTFLEVMAAMASLFEEPLLQADYAEKAVTLKKNINIDWWNPEENRYFDFRSSKEKAIQLIDMALEKRVIDGRNEWAKERLQNLKKQILSGDYPYDGYSVFYNASTLSPLTAGIADKEKAIAALEEASFFTNKFGLYVAGVARPDDITLEETSVKYRLKDEFNYNEAIMTAGTNSLAIAECKYRGMDYALKYIHQIVNNFSFATPGTTYEVSPDYGMFVQAWNICGINIPLIQYMFGVNPDAYQRMIHLHPDIPGTWEYATLENLIVGSNLLSMDYKKKNNAVTWIIKCSENDWDIDFQLPETINQVKVNGQTVAVSNGSIHLSGKENRIEF